MNLQTGTGDAASRAPFCWWAPTALAPGAGVALGHAAGGGTCAQNSVKVIEKDAVVGLAAHRDTQVVAAESRKCPSWSHEDAAAGQLGANVFGARHGDQQEVRS